MRPIRVVVDLSANLPRSMSYRCEVCGKEPSYGKTVSFSHKRNNRRWLPNIQMVRVKHGSNTRRARVCTSCIRAGKIQKA
jgi:large subunit ribosomal protein L28